MLCNPTFFDLIMILCTGSACQLIVTRKCTASACQLICYFMYRQCMSADCYAQVYSRDPLEAGEIDVRKKSFKGCFHQGFNNKQRILY